ncbi:MAG: choice-of-anchor A family protein, partial [Lachnospiraceae bacterium]
MIMRKRWVKTFVAMLALVAMLLETAYSAYASVSVESGSTQSESTIPEGGNTPAPEAPAGESTVPEPQSPSQPTPETPDAGTIEAPEIIIENPEDIEDTGAVSASLNAYEDRIEADGMLDMTLYINTDQMNDADRYSLALEGSGNASLQYDAVLSAEMSKTNGGIYYISGLNQEPFKVYASGISEGMSVQYSVRPDGNPQITLVSAPEEEIQKKLTVSEDGSQITGEGYEDLTLSFESADLPDNYYFALLINTSAAVSYNGSKLVSGSIPSLSNKTNSIRLSDLNKQAFSLYIMGENVDTVQAFYSIDSVDNGTARITVSLGEEAEEIQTLNASTEGITGSGYEKIELSMEYIEKIVEKAKEDAKSEVEEADLTQAAADTEELSEAAAFSYSLYIETKAENAAVNGQKLEDGKAHFSDTMESVLVDGLEKENFRIYAVADEAEDTTESAAISYSVKSVENGTAKIVFTYTTEADETANKRVYEYEDSKVKIKITLQNPEDLPDKAELSASEIKEGTAKYEEIAQRILEQKKAEKGAFLSLGQAIYDIHFILDGEEIEPKNEVKVEMVYKSPALEEASANPENEEASVYHVKEDDAGNLEAIEEVTQDISKSAEGGISEAVFTVSDFSSFSATLDANGKWTNGRLTYELNRTANGFTGTKYYHSDRALGIAGNFHIVAFDTATLKTHTNGNVLTKNLIANSNFGTNNLPDEISYVQNSYTGVQESSASKEAHTLALGSNFTVGLFDNNNYFSVNGTKVARPLNIIQDSDTSANPFIDIDAVKSSVSSISNGLAGVANTGVTASLTDQNDRSLTLNTPSGAGYYNMTASELNGYSSNKFDLKGFESGKSGSIIINVNCSGASVVNMPQSANIYVDGKMVSASEITEWSAGKVIWNFYNCSGTTINATSVFGAIVAVGATLNVNKGNGTFIADKVTVTGETHRTDFTGITTPTSANMTVSKSFDGTWPESGFQFKME